MTMSPSTVPTPRPTVGVIWAQALGGVIGVNGEMPWHLPEDLAYFRTVTRGSPVVMGRKTWESLPEDFRPLPGRTNVVITRDDSRSDELAQDGALTAPSLHEAVDLASSHAFDTSAIWIMGGGEIYAEALESGIARIATVTQIDLEVDGDTFAPPLEEDTWYLVSSMPESGWETSETGLRYRFDTYARR